MPSSFSWLDYSEQDRQRTLDVIDLFRESDTRDELGIGIIRDAFSNLLFPGISTIQTRAKYFLFIPWIYQDLENKRVPSAKITDRARREEVRLIHGLLSSGETEGVIGAIAKDDLKRLPSSIYWQGLEDWGIRLYSGPLSQYHRSLDTYYRARSTQLHTEDGDLVGAALLSNWHAGLPAPPPNFPDTATLKLTREQADYLRERLLTSVGESLVAYLVALEKPVPEVPFPWLLPQAQHLPPDLTDWLSHARNFSELIWGAALLYNLMLAKCDKSERLVDRYQNRLNDWANMLQQRMEIMSRWDRADFWQIIDAADSRVPIPTRRFVDQWWELALRNPKEIPTNREAQELIRQREYALKKGQARLYSRRALEMWGGAAGTAQLDYRWGIAARQIIIDILDGLGR